jgi:hypothetical protein
MKYKTIKKVNFRTGPGKSYKKVGVLKKGTSITAVGRSGKWVKFKKGNKLYFCHSKNLKEVKNYGRIVGAKVLPLAKRVVANKAKHESGAYTYKKHRINCSVFVSKVLQNAGVLKEGTTLYHTSKNHSKGSLDAVVKNRSKVKHYKWYKTNTLYKSLPKKWKKQGCVYVYASSVAIVGADGYIYGCHSSGKTYKKLSMIRHKGKSYEYTSRILAVGVPKTE